MLTGGESGPAVVPGKPDESVLLDMISGEKPEMAQKDKPLSKPLPPLRSKGSSGLLFFRLTKGENHPEDGKLTWMAPSFRAAFARNPSRQTTKSGFFQKLAYAALW